MTVSTKPDELLKSGEIGKVELSEKELDGVAGGTIALTNVLISSQSISGHGPETPQE
jgi:hypothetical protein